MNQKTLSFIAVVLAFLGGSFIAVLDPVEVNWTWMVPVLLIGAAGIWGFRSALHAEASSGERVDGNMQMLGEALDRINRNLADLNARKSDLPVYEARFEIDRLFREDLNNFAEARETMVHVFGMKHYADVMSAFAAGERYINRVWSASTDGYIDEVSRYLQRASDQFSEAVDLFEQLRASSRAA